jgi:hypothetical protein
MGEVAKRVTDPRMLKLLRAFLNAGVMESVTRFITKRLKPKVNQQKARWRNPYVRWFGRGGRTTAPRFLIGRIRIG